MSNCNRRVFGHESTGNVASDVWSTYNLIAVAFAVVRAYCICSSKCLLLTSAADKQEKAGSLIHLKVNAYMTIVNEQCMGDGHVLVESWARRKWHDTTDA